MREIHAYDAEGTKLSHGDFVQLLEDHPYNKKLKKGTVVRVSHWGKRIGTVVWLMGKGGQKVYNNGVKESQIKKVNYSMEKRKIIT